MPPAVPGVDPVLLDAAAKAAKSGTGSRRRSAPMKTEHDEGEEPNAKTTRGVGRSRTRLPAQEPDDAKPEAQAKAKGKATPGGKGKATESTAEGTEGETDVNTICDASRKAGLEQIRQQQKQLMQFKRSREGPDHGPNSKHKCPGWLRECMPPPKSSKFKHWFHLWLQSEGDWGKVMLKEVLIRKQSKKTTKGWEWLLQEKIEKRFSPAVAEALITACTDNPAWNKGHAQIGNCSAAHKYYILTSEVTLEIEEHTAAQELKVLMDFDGEVPKEVANSLPGAATSNWDPSGSAIPTTSPHKAIEDDPQKTKRLQMKQQKRLQKKRS